VIHFELVTLTGIQHEGEIYEVLLPTPEGTIAVFKNHMPLVSIISPGIIKVREKSNHPDDFLDTYATAGGVVEILDNKIRVLVDEADHSDDINAADAKKALDEARKLQSNAKDQVSLNKAQSLIDMHNVRLQVSSIKHRKKRKRTKSL